MNEKKTSPASTVSDLSLNTALKEEKLHIISCILIIGMHVFALLGLFYFSFAGLKTLLIGHFLTGCIGISIGFHRLLSHRSFQPNELFKNSCAFLGTLAFQNGPLTWSAFHRAHHAHTDQIGDPHSSNRGYAWSHMLWMLHSRPNGFRFSQKKNWIKDLSEDRWLHFLESNYLKINFFFFLVCCAIFRRADLIFWGFPVRIVCYWHCTWLVNSYCHSNRADKQLTAKNSMLVTLLTYGEGWHRNHHLQPRSASFQRMWYQIDPSYIVLLLLSKLKVIDLPRPLGFFGHADVQFDTVKNI